MKALAAMALLCMAASAHAASGTIKGTVTSTLGQPVTTGHIEITVNGVPNVPAVIDGTGAYMEVVTWAGTAPAACHLQTASTGFVEQSADVGLAPGGTTTQDFVLTPNVVFDDGFEAP